MNKNVLHSLPNHQSEQRIKRNFSQNADSNLANTKNTNAQSPNMRIKRNNQNGERQEDVNYKKLSLKFSRNKNKTSLNNSPIEQDAMALNSQRLPEPVAVLETCPSLLS